MNPLEKVYLVYFFEDYIEMYYAQHGVKYVVLTEEEAIEIVKTENCRLKEKQDYNKGQKAYYEVAPIGKNLSN